MEMLNRAIEDASDFKGMMRKLDPAREAEVAKLREAMMKPARQVEPLGPENRTQRRARERAERKAALKQSKVKA